MTDDPFAHIDKSYTGSEIIEDPFSPGSLFASRYEIITEGRKGGMGIVYKVKDTKLRGKITALKVIHQNLLSSEHILEMFRQEVAISLDLSHPNIVRVYGINDYNSFEFFTMEWIEGKTLREIVDEKKETGKPFTLDEAYPIISQLCDALTEAHKHTVHRDIKPENILIASDNTLKLTDFGLAMVLDVHKDARKGIGTAYYMSPEQKNNPDQVDKRSDIYSVGVILFELLTLENVIGLEPPSELNPSLPKEIDSITKKALATKRENRYGDAEELSDALTKIAEKEKEIPIAEKTIKYVYKNNVWIYIPEFNIATGKYLAPVLNNNGDVISIKKYSDDYDIEKSIRSTLNKAFKNNYVKFIDDEINSNRLKKIVEKETEQYTCPVTGIESVFVKGGTYEMGDTFGDANDDEKPVHTVTVNDFYLGKYLVTQGQWKKIMGNNPSRFQEGDDYPVESVSWDAAQEFIKELNRKTDGKYRLPTEAEWEYAARERGKKVRFGTGKDSISTEEANFDASKDYVEPYSSAGEYREKTTQVGTFKPNSLGLYDMSGNVCEWCHDWFDENYYKDSPKDNPQGPSTGSPRVLRGGCWFSFPRNVRAASRFIYHPSIRYNVNGFRVAASPG